MADQKSQSMHVKVYTPFKVYYDGEATSLTAANKTGPFDVLPQHKNFMSLLTPGTITVRAPGKPDFTLPISRAVIHVKADQAIVFLDV